MEISLPRPHADATLPRAPELPSAGLLGHLLTFRTDPLGLFTRAMTEVGDVAQLRTGPAHIVFAFHPDHVEQVLLRNATNYVKHTRGYDKLRLVLGDGLVTSEGAKWKAQRRIVNPAFHQRCLQGFSETMARAAEDRVAAWRPLAGTGRAVDVSAAMSALTLRVVGETLFGTGFEAETAEIGRALDVVLHHVNRLVSSPFPWAERLPTLPNHRFWGAVRSLHRVVDGLVADRLANPVERADLLGMLLDARGDEGRPMPPQQLRDELVTLVLAGHETTSNALSWTFYLLSEHPVVARRVQDELSAVLGGRTPSMADLRALPYLHQVLRESMRLYPPVWALGRTAVQDDVIGGYAVPAGSFVYVSPFATHRHPAFWTNPEGFDPDRFTPEAVASRHRCAYFPFSAGQRKCLGDRFAEMEALIVLATALQHLRLDLVPGHRVQPEATITLRPRDGLPMTVRSAAKGDTTPECER